MTEIAKPKIKKQVETDLFKNIFDLEKGFINVKNIKKLKKLTFTEIYDSNKLAFILNNLSDIKKTYRPEARDDLCLETYYNNSKFNNDVNLGFKINKYHQKKNNLYTRMYGSISGQGMVRECRSSIYSDLYNDLDINNCHPVITKWICKNINLECKYISEYIENRDSIFDELISLNPTYSRGKFKQVFLAIMYGGSKDYEDVPVKNTFIENYKNEISSIHNTFSKVFFNFFKIVEKLAITKAEYEKYEVYNVEGKNASQICGFVENQLLQYMISYIKEKLPEDKFNNTILCFDGLMFRSGFINNEDMINDLEKIYSDMNISIKLSIKPFSPLDLKSFGYDESIKYKYKSIEKPKEEITELEPDDVLDNNESNLIRLITETGFLDHDVADYFINKFKNYIYYDSKLYFYNGSYWEQSIDSYEIIKTLTNEYFYINDKINKYIKFYKNKENENINILERLTKAIKDSKKLRTSSNLKAITEAIKSKISINKDIFDSNPLLVGFLNGTYDLKLNIFRENKLEDYITKCNNYDFEFINDNNDNMILLKNFLKKVMPENDELEYLLLILSTTLYSNTLDAFIIATGAGGNAKDTIFTNLMPSVICDNYYKGNICTITKKANNGVNQELANCHKRNMVLFNEPDCGDKVITSTVKDMSGGKNINARGIYCNNTNTKLTCSIFMLSNELPLLDKVDKAMERRLIVFKFKTLFSKQEDLDKYKIKEGKNEDGHHYYLADPYFSSLDFIEKVKLSMMNLLIQSFQKFQNNKYILTKSPKSIEDNNKQYLSSSDNFISWFNSEYKFTNDETNTIKLKDIYNDYKDSYLYENLTKQDKRVNNYNWFSELIKNNIYLRHYFKENNSTKTLRRHLFSYKKIKINVDGEDEDENEDISDYERDINKFKFSN